MLLLNHPEHRQVIFFQQIFQKISQTIHLYCFSQYRKYLYKIFSDHYGPIHFKRYINYSGNISI